jgi:hypothetical protein
MIRLALLAALVTLASVAHADGGATLPRHDYLLQCAGCHGIDGRGSAVVPTLHGLVPVLAIEGGRGYLVRVPGVAQAPVTSRRLATLLNWIFTEFNATSVDPPFTEAEVARSRSQPLRNPISARNDLLALEPTATASSAHPR